MLLNAIEMDLLLEYSSESLSSLIARFDVVVSTPFDDVAFGGPGDERCPSELPPAEPSIFLSAAKMQWHSFWRRRLAGKAEVEMCSLLRSTRTLQLEELLQELLSAVDGFAFQHPFHFRPRSAWFLGLSELVDLSYLQPAKSEMFSGATSPVLFQGKRMVAWFVAAAEKFIWHDLHLARSLFRVPVETPRSEDTMGEGPLLSSGAVGDHNAVPGSINTVAIRNNNCSSDAALRVIRSTYRSLLCRLMEELVDRVRCALTVQLANLCGLGSQVLGRAVAVARRKTQVLPETAATPLEGVPSPDHEFDRCGHQLAGSALSVLAVLLQSSAVAFVFEAVRDIRAVCVGLVLSEQQFSPLHASLWQWTGCALIAASVLAFPRAASVIFSVGLSDVHETIRRLSAVIDPAWADGPAAQRRPLAWWDDIVRPWETADEVWPHLSRGVMLNLCGSLAAYGASLVESGRMPFADVEQLLCVMGLLHLELSRCQRLGSYDGHGAAVRLSFRRLLVDAVGTIGNGWSDIACSSLCSSDWKHHHGFADASKNRTSRATAFVEAALDMLKASAHAVLPAYCDFLCARVAACVVGRCLLPVLDAVPGSDRKQERLQADRTECRRLSSLATLR